MTEESKTKQIKPQGATTLNEEMRDEVTQHDFPGSQVHRQKHVGGGISVGFFLSL